MGKGYRDIVRQQSRAKKSARAVLNVLADYADDDGVAWPGRATLAHDSGLSERQVVRALQQLNQDDELEQVNGGNGRGHFPHYRILLAADGAHRERLVPKPAQKGDILTPILNGDISAERVTNLHGKGDKSRPEGTRKGDKSARHIRRTNKRTGNGTGEGGRKRPAAQPRPTDETLTHFAVVAYQEKFNLTPNLDQRLFIVQNVTDEALWRDAMWRWNLKKYNPKNVLDLVDFYHNSARWKNGANHANGRNGSTNGHATNDDTGDGRPKIDPDIDRRYQEHQRQRALERARESAAGERAAHQM